MISSLLKDRGLGLQLVVGVGLLLVLGAFPEPSEGLRCYNCDDWQRTDVPKCTEPEIRECPPNATNCFYWETDWNPGTGKRREQRGCMGNVRVECLKNQFENRSIDCVAGKGSWEYYAVETRLRTCRRTDKQTSRNVEENNFVYHCICGGDLCNSNNGQCHCNSTYTRMNDSEGGGSGGDGTDGDGSGGGDSGGSDHSSSSILHPFNSIIIIAILTVARPTSRTLGRKMMMISVAGPPFPT